MTGYLNGGSNVTDGTVKNGLQDIYAALGIRAQVNVHTFSFLSNDIAQQMETLQRADIFWFAGVHAVPERLKQALSRSNDETGVNDLAAQVRRRVQYEHMPYVGVCGGAQMASSPETCGYGCGLDLMQGQEIYYASHEERNNVGSKFFFTEKCAFAVLLEATRCFAVAFPCTKDGGEVWAYAEVHAGRLESILKQLASEWKSYRRLNEELWHFNLRGYFAISSKTYLYRDGMVICID